MPRVRVLGVGRSDGSNTAREKKKKANHMPYAKGRRSTRVSPATPRIASRMGSSTRRRTSSRLAITWATCKTPASGAFPVPCWPPGPDLRDGRRDHAEVAASVRPNTPIPQYFISHIPHPTSHIPPTASRGRCLGRCPPTWLALPAAWSPFSRRDDFEEQTPVPSRVFYDQ